MLCLSRTFRTNKGISVLPNDLWVKIYALSYKNILHIWICYVNWDFYVVKNVFVPNLSILVFSGRSGHLNTFISIIVLCLIIAVWGSFCDFWKPSFTSMIWFLTCNDDISRMTLKILLLFGPTNNLLWFLCFENAFK